MRKRTFAGRLLLFAIFFLGCSNLMNARSQNALYASYAQGNAGMYNQTNGNFQKDQARAFSSLLAEARKTFDVDFIYESRILPGVRLVMDVEKYKTVEEFLDELLKPYNLKYKKVLAKAYVIYSSSAELKRLISAMDQSERRRCRNDLAHSGAAAPRSIPITGRILDQAKGIPLEGVSITVKGSNKGTLTDQNGNFKLQVDNENAVLVVSLIGYETKEMTVSGRTDFQLSLVAQTTVAERCSGSGLRYAEEKRCNGLDFKRTCQRPGGSAGIPGRGCPAGADNGSDDRRQFRSARFRSDGEDPGDYVHQ